MPPFVPGHPYQCQQDAKGNKVFKEIQTNDVGAVTGFVETASWREVNAVVIDNSRCIRCGECMRVCPVDCISVTRVELTERRVKEEESNG